MTSHFAYEFILIVADSTSLSPDPTGGDDLRAAAAVISAIAAAVATFFEYRSFSANKTKTESDYYQRTVARPSEDHIEEFRKSVTDLLSSHEDQMKLLRNTTVLKIKEQVAKTKSQFEKHITDLKYHLRSAAASSNNSDLTKALIDAADRLETDVMEPIVEEDKKLDDEVFD